MHGDDDILAWGNPKDGFLIWDQLDQLTIEFNVAGSIAKMLLNKKIKNDAVQKRVHAQVDALMEIRAGKLKARGVRIFEIQEHNDFDAIEADFGAPAKGLSFFRDLMDPTRSFRYEPVHVFGNSIYKTHKAQAIAVAKAHKRAGFQTFYKKKQDDYPDSVHFSNGGATKAFSDVIELITQQHQAQQKHKAPLGIQHKAAVIVPVPNYGLFLWRMEEAFAGTDIALLPVRRQENGAVELNFLRSTLTRCFADNRRVLAYYDCNPQNPTGHIRERDETESIAALIEENSDAWRSREMSSVLTRISADPESRDYLSPWLIMSYGIHSTTLLIDDMSYEGLELDAAKKPVSFAQLSKYAADRTVVLKGVSKIGLPGARIGMVIAHPGVTDALATKQLMTEFAAHSPGVDILTARYAASPLRARFETHQKMLRKHHVYRAGMVEAFFNGLDRTDRLNERQKRDLTRYYAAHAGIGTKEARSRLCEGLSQFSLPESMDCGFFYRVNCEAMRGKPIAVKFKHSNWISDVEIQSSDTLHWVFRSFGMHVVTAGRQGCPENDLSVRITTSLPEKEMFRFYDAMRTMQDYFFGKNPAVQMDLFRKNVFRPV